jgi:hypothetical protein
MRDAVFEQEEEEAEEAATEAPEVGGGAEQACGQRFECRYFPKHEIFLVWQPKSKDSLSWVQSRPTGTALLATPGEAWLAGQSQLIEC